MHGRISRVRILICMPITLSEIFGGFLHILQANFEIPQCRIFTN